MGNIEIVERPDWISYEMIHDLLYSAHAINREKGFHVTSVNLSGEELKEHIGSDGKCFVALDGSKLVGTTSYRVVNRNFWCAKGLTADRIFAGVHPDYKGKHISSMLFDKVVEDVKERGILYIESTTQEQNEIVQKKNLKDGYRYISFRAPKDADYYSVVMLQWQNGCPLPKWKTDLHFILKKAQIKLLYKKGGRKRFGF